MKKAIVLVAVVAIAGLVGVAIVRNGNKEEEPEVIPEDDVFRILEDC